MVSQKHCNEPKNDFGGENGGWCIGDALKLENTSYFQSIEAAAVIVFAAIEEAEESSTEEEAAVKEEQEDNGLKKRRKNQQAFWKRSPYV